MDKKEQLIAFSKEYLKDKDLKEEMYKAIAYCRERNLIKQETIQAAQDKGWDAMRMIGSKALTMFLLDMMNSQQAK